MTHLTRDDEELAATVALVLLGSRDAAAAVSVSRRTLRRQARRVALANLKNLPETYRTQIETALKRSRRKAKCPPLVNFASDSDEQTGDAVESN